LPGDASQAGYAAQCRSQRDLRLGRIGLIRHRQFPAILVKQE